MNTSGIRRRPSSAALSTSLVLAVAVMHVLVMGCAMAGGTMAGGAMGSGSMSGGSMTTAPLAAAPLAAAQHEVSAVVSAATSSTEHIAASASDCMMGDHGCVFVRADAVVLIAAIGFLVAFAMVCTALVARLPRRTVVLGRPPPWAVLDHLQLSVIRR